MYVPALEIYLGIIQNTHDFPINKNSDIKLTVVQK